MADHPMTNLGVTLTVKASSAAQYAVLQAWKNVVIALNPGVYTVTQNNAQRTITFTGTQNANLVY